MTRRKNFSRNSIKVGDQYGYWTVISQPTKDKAGHWLARCICGHEKLVEGYTLVTGKSTKCLVCGNRERAKKIRKFGDIVAARQAWSKHRQSARERNLTTTVSFDEFYEISKMPCWYCGDTPISGYWENSSYKREWHEPFISNGIDRVDNSKGYIKGNIMPCCIRCNRAKNDMTIEEWKIKINKWSEWASTNA